MGVRLDSRRHLHYGWQTSPSVIPRFMQTRFHSVARVKRQTITPMAKRMIAMLAAMLVLVGGIFVLRSHQISEYGQAAAAQVRPPVTVSAELAREDVWQPTLRTSGSLLAVQGVMMSNESAGVVEAIGFESGDVVQKGALLVQLNVTADQAQLRAPPQRRYHVIDSRKP